MRLDIGPRTVRGSVHTVWDVCRINVLATAIGLLGVALAAGCTASSAAPVSAEAVANPSPDTGAASRTPGTPSSTSGAVAVASPSPAPAIEDVSPAEVAVGGVVLSLAFEPPRHMLDQAMVATSDPARQPEDPSKGPVSEGAVVLGDMVHVTNNLDATQPLPGDSAQSILRHVHVQIRTKDGSQVVPYIGVSMDVLLDGHPVQFGQSIVPMVADPASSSQLYYGNNIRLPQRGTYQVFIRMASSPLLGKDQPQAAQFNLVVH
jgi:hypothetical protein